MFEPLAYYGKFRFKKGIHLIFGKKPPVSLAWLESHYITEHFNPASDQKKLDNSTIYIDMSKISFNQRYRKLPDISTADGWPPPTPINTIEQKLFFSSAPETPPHCLPSVPSKFLEFFTSKQEKGFYAIDPEREIEFFCKDSITEDLKDEGVCAALDTIYKLPGKNIFQDFKNEITKWTKEERSAAFCLLGKFATRLAYANYIKTKETLGKYLTTTCSVCKKVDAQECLRSIEEKVMQKALWQEVEIDGVSTKDEINKGGVKLYPPETKLAVLHDEEDKAQFLCSMAFKLREMDSLKNKLKSLKPSWYGMFSSTNLAFWEVRAEQTVFLTAFRPTWEKKQKEHTREALETILSALPENEENINNDLQTNLLKYLQKQTYFKSILRKTSEDKVSIKDLHSFVSKFLEDFCIEKPWKTILNNRKEKFTDPSVQSWLIFDIGRFYCMWQINKDLAEVWALDPLAKKDELKFPSESLGPAQLQKNLKKYFTDNKQHEYLVSLMLATLVKITLSADGEEINVFQRNSKQPEKIIVMLKGAFEEAKEPPGAKHKEPKRATDEENIQNMAAQVAILSKDDILQILNNPLAVAGRGDDEEESDEEFD